MRNHCREIRPTTRPSVVSCQSLSVKLPVASSRDPSASVTSYRCLMGEKNAGLTVAMTPSRSSMSIVSRIANSFLRMRARRSPDASLSSKVSRRLSALPSTKKTRSPFSSSIQKSALKEKMRS